MFRSDRFVLRPVARSRNVTNAKEKSGSDGNQPNEIAVNTGEQEGEDDVQACPTEGYR